MKQKFHLDGQITHSALLTVPYYSLIPMLHTKEMSKFTVHILIHMFSCIFCFVNWKWYKAQL